MILDQYGWRMHRIDVIATETVYNHHTRLFLVLGHLTFHHAIGARDAVVEVVGMGGADVGNVLAGLRPCSGIGAVGVDDAAQFGELTLEYQLSGRVAGGIQFAIDNFACLEVYYHHVGSFHHVVIDA